MSLRSDVAELREEIAEVHKCQLFILEQLEKLAGLLREALDEDDE